MTEFEGPVWVNDDSDFESESDFEVDSDNDFFVDEMFWPVLNGFQASRFDPSFLNRAMNHTGRYVFRLGNLGMTYDPELVLPITSDPDILATDSLIEMFARLRSIYFAHDEDVAYGIIDRFLSMYGMSITLRHPIVIAPM